MFSATKYLKVIFGHKWSQSCTWNPLFSERVTNNISAATHNHTRPIVCKFISPFVCDQAPDHSHSIRSPISRPASQENRWSLLTERLLLRSAANNAALSPHHSGQFSQGFSRWSVLYQPSTTGAREDALKLYCTRTMCGTQLIYEMGVV